MAEVRLLRFAVEAVSCCGQLEEKVNGCVFLLLRYQNLRKLVLLVALSAVRPSSRYVRLSSGLSPRRVRVTGTDGPLCPRRAACNVQSLPKPRLNAGL